MMEDDETAAPRLLSSGCNIDIHAITSPATRTKLEDVRRFATNYQTSWPHWVLPFFLQTFPRPS